jgi:hypothetical protein
VEYWRVHFDECGGEQTITWTFTDECGRTIEHIQTITIEPAPVADWIDAPADITLTCDEAQNFTVTDLSYTNNETESCEISGSVAEYLRAPLMSAAESRQSPGRSPMIATERLSIYRPLRLSLLLLQSGSMHLQISRLLAMKLKTSR